MTTQQPQQPQQSQQPRQAPPPSTLAFTPAMRDLQARGKNPFQGQPGHEDHHSVMHLGLGQCLPNDTYEARERRNFAMSVLNSPEKLMMYAQSEDDSISSQRLRFMQLAAGLPGERSISDRSRFQAPALGEQITSGTDGHTVGEASSG
ncbi:unnamed protein product [Clonostachys rosea]|uniref:Uncharacterized protein n=1 Tax=Bionectria ochroleuca TaxID=29856 RepID=A0ABY6ULA2_BIOOC|nr:unnamed protein product [Clonostachys rosea]